MGFEDLNEKIGQARWGIHHQEEIRVESLVILYCPTTGYPLADNETEPESYNPENRRATYTCRHCSDGPHIFVWGPPAPILVKE